MDTLVKLNSQTAGRDKIARLLQYLSRVLWHRLQNSNKDTASNLKNLEYQLSTFRKFGCLKKNSVKLFCSNAPFKLFSEQDFFVCQQLKKLCPIRYFYDKFLFCGNMFLVLRFGRCVDTLYSALPLFQHDDQAVKYSTVLSKICTSLFLLADHVLWLGRSDVCSIETEKWTKISNKFWLFSITMNLVRDFYEISNILKNDKMFLSKEKSINYSYVAQRFISLMLSNKHVFVDTIKNGCDIFIPLTALGHLKLSPGTIGILGAISSVAGMMVLIDPHLKLSP